MNMYLRNGVIPSAMNGRPIDHRGFVVPWFVTRKDKDDHWDFARIEGSRFTEAIQKSCCWVSGKPLGVYKSFCIGPMCIINRVSGDPPVTKEIAEWSVKVCPFMSRPLARRDRSISEETHKEQRGCMIARNPGVTAIYTTKKYQLSQQLFRLGAPESVTWWSEGRPATRAEVDASIASGLPTLEEMAKKQGGTAIKELELMINAALPLLP